MTYVIQRLFKELLALGIEFQSNEDLSTYLTLLFKASYSGNLDVHIKRVYTNWGTIDNYKYVRQFTVF